MTRFTDYLYATVPSFCIAAPIAQILPDLSFFQGLEKLGIVGIMGLLSKFGSYVRQGARRSIRTRKRVSFPGHPPSGHVGTLKRGILFG